VVAQRVLAGPAGLVLDRGWRKVDVDGTPAHLAPHEVDLLELLLVNQGRIVSFEELAEAAWGAPASADLDAVFAAVWRLRQALAAVGAPDVIDCIPNVGYSIAEDQRPPTLDLEHEIELDRAALLATASRRLSGGPDGDPGGDPVGAGALGQLTGLSFAAADRGDASTALPDWTDEDRERIHDGVLHALTSGHAELRDLHWTHDGVVALLDVELVRVEHELGPRLVCDILAVRAASSQPEQRVAVPPPVVLPLILAEHAQPR
jgi:DNA-binding winged helix-turn-helix (wHTH) protein